MTIRPARPVRGAGARRPGGRRGGRRAAAGLACLAVTLPLAALPGTAAAVVPAQPGGRVATLADDNCSRDTPKLVDQTPPGLLVLGAGAANTVATGKGVTVAVVDSGVDATNVHLRGGVVLPGFDVSGARTPNGQTDYAGHGTAIAGEIAARKVAGSGVVGLAYDAKILPVRVFTQEEDDNSGPAANGGVKYPPTSTNIALGIQTAAAAGAKIINVSLSTNTNSAALSGAVAYATRKGALVVASAGNRNTSQDKTNSARYPGADPNALAVAATDSSGQVTDDSIHGSYVDVAAPGTNVLTAYYNAGDCQLADDAASTSYATAYVSAAAALIAQAHPTETPAQWRYRLEATALRARPDARSDESGWGLIQPYEALTFVSDGTAAGPQDPAVSAPPTQAPAVQRIDPVVATIPDTTARDQTLWLTLGGVVAVLALALVALLRRDRKKPVRPPREPAGVR